MAVFEYFDDMYDIRLKPKLLRSVITDLLPDERHPFPNPSQLSKAVSMVKTHGLLSECFTGPVDRKFLDRWKSAVDAWIDRLFLLLSSSMPDKCWAGICLLGVTCQECSADRFLSSYSDWFQKLYTKFQPLSDSQFVKLASCASLSDLFTRLSGFPNVKKDGISQSGKLIQPVLKLLTDDGSEAVWDGALDLLCTIIKIFPPSVHRHYDSVEVVIVSKMMSGKCSADMSKKFAHCLALLPRTKGDEQSWSLMMEKILIAINVHLTDAFQDLEVETISGEIMRLIVPPGKNSPPPLGGQLLSETLDRAAIMSKELLLARVSILMLCCCKMLSNTFPVQVTVPVRPLLKLVRRVLLVDGSLSQPSIPLTTVTQQEFICSELPILHSYSLDMLTAIIKGIRGQLLPHAADVARLLTEYFRRCSLPELRIKVYSIIQILLISMGVGMTLYLAQEVIDHAFMDLDAVGMGIGGETSHQFSKSVNYTLQQLNERKRKHASTIATTLVDQSDVGLAVELPKIKPVALLSVRVAALRTLETLLTVGGAWRSENWRSNVDHLIITIATNACDIGWANVERCASNSLDQSTTTWEDFQLASLHALLASLLSPAHVRPPYLSPGLEIFHRGRQETGTRLAEFCAHALLALELLIHPRALPICDFPSSDRVMFDSEPNVRIPENIFSSAQKSSTPFKKGVMEPDPDGDLYDSWLGNGEEIEASVTNMDEIMENAQENSEKFAPQSTAEGLQVEKQPTVSGANVGEVLEQVERTSDELMIDVQRPKVSIDDSDVVALDEAPTNTSREEGAIESMKVEENNAPTEPGKVAAVPCMHNASMAASMAAECVIPQHSSLASEGDKSVGVNCDTPVSTADLTVASDLGSSKGKEIVIDDNSDTDSFPDIIVGDPDSD